MSKFGEYELKKGDLVLIEADCRKGGLKETELIGKFEKRIQAQVFNMETSTPVFILENGDVIHGYECFWLPLDEANEVLEEKGLPKIDSVSVDRPED